MKRSSIILLVVVGILVLWVISAQRGFVSKEEGVNKSWADVQSAYQRRFDLFDNLQAVVEGAADFEKSTLTEVIEARAKATSVNIDANNLSPENIQKFQAAQGEFNSSLSRLLVTVEQYPQLTATQAFREFQAQIEGTENRINVARNAFNESVRTYNIAIRKFPNSLFAGMFGFDKKGSFESDKGAEKAPKIDFKKDKK